MSTSEFDKYKVDHLFLLIGENPLPNYVAANLLLNKGGTAYFLHTAGTVDEARRLRNIFSSELNGFQAAQLISLGEYESDAYHIREIIRPQIQSLKTGKLGLNYTGGTKAMAVHAYRTVFSQVQSTVFSYVDPRRLEICIDREENERIRIKVKPDTLEVKLVKIFQIHGLELEGGNPTQETQLPELAEELAKIFKNEDKAKQWCHWFYKEFCEKARKKKQNDDWGDWQSKTALESLSIPLENLPQEIVTVFRQKKFVMPDDKLSLQKAQKIGLFKDIKSFCEWLGGLWLEHYVLLKIKIIVDSLSINDYGMTFKVPLKGTKSGFEFDVAFMRGYQLFAISCSTTSRRSLCKEKLFEAYHRARQMGGDEARVALVCCSDEPDSIKAEMSDTLANKKITVFGREDLINLSEKITEWIVQNDRETK